MDPDGTIDGFHQDSPSGGVCTSDHPSSSGCYVAKVPPSSNDTDSRNSVYTSADLASLVAIENEAASFVRQSHNPALSWKPAKTRESLLTAISKNTLLQMDPG
jgi:hypothetical protein